MRTMRGVVLRGAGGCPETLLASSSTPLARAPLSGEVRVRVKATAVAYRDILDRKGAFPFIKNPTILGHEFAGIVESVGEDCSEFKVGDRVASMHWAQDVAWPCPLGEGAVTAPNDTFFGLTIDGGYAEYATNREAAFCKVPNSGWSPIDVAPVMSTFGTFWMGGVVRAGLKPSDRVLVTGASGGVGSASVLLAKALGCEVVGVTSSADKVQFVKDLGADEVICAAPDGRGNVVFGREPFLSDGVDMVAECVGDPTFTSSLRCLKPEGRICLMGNTTNAASKLPLGLMILKSLSIYGTDSIHRQEMERLFEFLDDHDLRPRISEVMRLEDAADAHRKVENKLVSGRIVLQVDEDLSW